jgi:hypothetical protein
MKQPKQINKTTISDAQLNAELKLLFEGGNTDKGKCLEVLGSKYKIQVQRFYKKFNEAHLEWQEAKAKATNEAIQANATAAVNSAYMSAQQRRDLLSQMANGEIKVKIPFVIGGKIMEYPSEASLMERKAAIAELNKMDGDYAPTKTALTNVDGKDIDLSKVPVIFK